MSDYGETLREHARIAILRFLEGAPKYTSNASMLKALLPNVGITYSLDQIISELAWLRDCGLVWTEDHDGFVVATANMRGVEVAQGIVRHPGIQRPKPGS